MKIQSEALEDTIETIGPKQHPNFFAPKLTAFEMRCVIQGLWKGSVQDVVIAKRLQKLLDWKPAHEGMADCTECGCSSAECVCLPF